MAEIISTMKVFIIYRKLMCLEILYVMNLSKLFVIPFSNIEFEELIYYL